MEPNLTAEPKGVEKKPLHILLADDDEDDRFFFTETVEHEDLKTEVQVVVDGNKLMELLETAAVLPELIFLDLNMPHCHGFDCLDKIRSTEKLKNIPVVIYATSIAKADIELAYAKGADYFVSKPKSTAEFRYILKLLFSKKWGGHQTPLREQFVVSAKNLRAAVRSLR